MMKYRRESFGHDPFDLHREIDRLFAQLLGSQQRPSPGRSSAAGDSPEKPPVEFLEEDNAYLIGLDVPDYRQEELEVFIAGDRLIVHGRRERSGPEDAFRRRFDLGREVSPEEVDAAFREGILVVRVAKPPAPNVRTIEVT